jgi:tetratricopeptide (TPR) repeat protein
VSKELDLAASLRKQTRTASGKQAIALAAQARTHAQRAGALLENGPANAALAARVERLLANLKADDEDRQFHTEVETAILAQVQRTAGGREYDYERTVRLLRKAFARYGLAAGVGDPQAAAQRIDLCPAEVRETVLAGLEQWLAVTKAGNSVNEPHREWLQAAWKALKPVELGKDVWVTEHDPVRRRKALEKLAASIDVSRTPWYAIHQLMVMLQLVGAHESAVALLQRAQVCRAGDLMVNLHLGNALEMLSPPDLAGAVRYYTAVVAVRPDLPDTHTILAGTLMKQHAYAEAESELRQALALDANYTLAHAYLGAVLCKLVLGFARGPV